MDQNIGKMLDNRYEILELVGVGGMAKVYKARCHRLNRLVAVKILRDDLSQDSDFRRRFHDESQAVAMLSHPNIVAVYDVSRSSELEYIVMELIEGITLKQYMQKKGNKLNWREALHFITQIIKALGHAHSRGIIHRDIKPHNIMVLRDGSVKVADFGIARLTSAGHSTLTQETLGSVHYISPEQARGSHIDSRSDLYSAGVVLYEMITGRLPFEGDSPVSVAIQHINSIPLSPRELNEEIPEALEAITMKAMAPGLDKRYVSADAMLADLEEFRKNPDIDFDYTLPVVKDEVEAEEKTRKVPVAAIPKSIRDQIPGTRREDTLSRKRIDEVDEYDDDRPNWPIYAAVSAVVLFIGVVLVFLYTSFIRGLFQPTPDYTVPELSGMLYEQVVEDKELLQEFTVLIANQITSDEPAGTILRQTPSGSSTTKDPKTQISLTVSTGPELILMPDVTGMDYHKALVALQNQGLKVPVPEYANDDEVASNHVISHTPLEGTQLRPGDEVHLVVSKGPAEKVELVPLFIGQTEEWARNKAELQNLVIGEVFAVWSADYPAGIVIDQSIDAYSEVPQGTAVNLQVSKGVDPEAQQTTERSKTFSIQLPADVESVKVTVKDGLTVVLERTVSTQLESAVSCTVTGVGTKSYDIFFDDQFKMAQQVDFNS